MSKNVFIFALFYVWLFMGGCVELLETPKLVQWSGPPILFQPMSAGTVLACLDEIDSLSPEEFKQFYDEALNIVTQEGDKNILPLVCLGLNPRASDKQFEKSIELIGKHTLTHPDDNQELQGLQSLLARLKEAKINKRLDSNKMRKILAKKKNLEKQIEQLKNIEKIITNKEHANSETK